MRNKDLKDYRKELWIGIAIAYVRSPNSTTKTGAGCWADAVLADFDKRFPYIYAEEKHANS